MPIDYAKIWEGEIHRQFIDSLEPEQIAALWRLLLVATFADDELSIEERRELAAALEAIPSFDAVLDLRSRDITRELEELHREFESAPENLVTEIAHGLSEDSARRGAFRTVVQLIQSDGFVDNEEIFVRELGKQLGLEPEVIDFAVMDARSSSE